MERIFNVNYFAILIYFVQVFYWVQILKKLLVLKDFIGSNVVATSNFKWLETRLCGSNVFKPKRLKMA